MNAFIHFLVLIIFKILLFSPLHFLMLVCYNISKHILQNLCGLRVICNLESFRSTDNDRGSSFRIYAFITH